MKTKTKQTNRKRSPALSSTVLLAVQEQAIAERIDWLAEVATQLEGAERERVLMRIGILEDAHFMVVKIVEAAEANDQGEGPAGSESSTTQKGL